MLLIYPNFVHTRDALDTLSTNNRVAINAKHPGFAPLLDAWPNLKDKSSVAKIGRTYAYIVFGPEVQNEVGLVAFNNRGQELQKDWTVRAAREVFSAKADTRVFRVGAIVFFIGTLVSVVAAAAEFLADKPINGDHHASVPQRRRRGRRA